MVNRLSEPASSLECWLRVVRRLVQTVVGHSNQASQATNSARNRGGCQCQLKIAHLRGDRAEAAARFSLAVPKALAGGRRDRSYRRPAANARRRLSPPSHPVRFRCAAIFHDEATKRPRTDSKKTHMGHGRAFFGAKTSRPALQCAVKLPMVIIVP